MILYFMEYLVNYKLNDLLWSIWSILNIKFLVDLFHVIVLEINEIFFVCNLFMEKYNVSMLYLKCFNMTEFDKMVENLIQFKYYISQ